MFVQPLDMDEALRVRGEMGADLVPIAGGTDIVVVLNRSSTGPKHFLDLTHVAGYADVRRDNGTWHLGGGATFSQLGRLPVRALADAAMTVGGPAIRNCATIAGNLGTASPAGDGCVALLAVDAEIELAHASRGRRGISIEQYFTGLRPTAPLSDAVVTAVRLPSHGRPSWFKNGTRGPINLRLAIERPSWRH